MPWKSPKRKQLFDIVALCDLNAPLASNLAAEIECGTASFEEILAIQKSPWSGFLQALRDGLI